MVKMEDHKDSTIKITIGAQDKTLEILEEAIKEIKMDDEIMPVEAGLVNFLILLVDVTKVMLVHFLIHLKIMEIMVINNQMLKLMPFGKEKGLAREDFMEILVEIIIEIKEMIEDLDNETIEMTGEEMMGMIEDLDKMIEIKEMKEILINVNL